MCTILSSNRIEHRNLFNLNLFLRYTYKRVCEKLIRAAEQRIRKLEAELAALERKNIATIPYYHVTSTAHINQNQINK